MDWQDKTVHFRVSIFSASEWPSLWFLPILIFNHILTINILRVNSNFFLIFNHTFIKKLLCKNSLFKKKKIVKRGLLTIFFFFYVMHMFILYVYRSATGWTLPGDVKLVQTRLSVSLLLGLAWLGHQVGRFVFRISTQFALPTFLNVVSRDFFN